MFDNGSSVGVNHKLVFDTDCYGLMENVVVLMMFAGVTMKNVV